MIRPFLLFRGPVKSLSGYGAHSRDILQGLYESNLFDIKIDSCPWGSTPLNALDENNIFHIWIKSNIVNQINKIPDFYVQVSVGNEFNPVGKFNIGITAGIETTVLPQDWIEPCNKMDLIIVPSQFSKDVMTNTMYKDTVHSHVRTKIEVLYEGIDINVYKKLDYDVMINKSNKIKNFFDSIPESFCFLFVGHWLKGQIGHDRKDVGMLIKRFVETFDGHSDKPALILKTSSATFSVRERERLRKLILELVHGNKNPPSIYLLFGDLSNENMNELYNHPKVKTMISFTKGEGFGRPLLEFSMVGKPIITSNWSGHLDFLNKEQSLLIEGELKDVHSSAVDQFIVNGSQWFQVDYLDASLKMIDIKNNYPVYLQNSEFLRLENKEKFSLKSMNKKLTDLFYNQIKLDDNKNKLPKLIYSS